MCGVLFCSFVEFFPTAMRKCCDDMFFLGSVRQFYCSYHTIFVFVQISLERVSTGRLFFFKKKPPLETIAMAAGVAMNVCEDLPS
jgi:hypothetical protein